MPGEEQAEDPSRHGRETATRSVEEASSTGTAVVTCEAEHATSRSATCRVEEWPHQRNKDRRRGRRCSTDGSRGGGPTRDERERANESPPAVRRRNQSPPSLNDDYDGPSPSAALRVLDL